MSWLGIVAAAVFWVVAVRVVYRESRSGGAR